MKRTISQVILLLTIHLVGLRSQTAFSASASLELENLKTNEQFFNWINSDAPIQWLDENFVGAKQWLREAKAIIKFHSRAMRNFATFKVPNIPTAYIICYPIVGSDFVTPFLLDATRSIVCDSAPLLHPKGFNTPGGIYSLFRPFIPRQGSSAEEQQHLFLGLLGFNHPYVPREDFVSPTGYLGILRLRLLLNTDNVTVRTISPPQHHIIFSKADIAEKNVITYFENINVLGTSSEDKERTLEFYRYLRQRYCPFVILKRSSEFSRNAKEFWRSIGTHSIVYADEPVKKYSGILGSFSPRPIGSLKLSEITDEFKDSTQETHLQFAMAAERFGYDHSIYLYWSKQLIR